jgi:glycosyltransferase involved in cell wall biosynthesis
MRISFVIPAYNEEHYIGICLDAIVQAIGNRNDVETIVVDNNSSDRTTALVAHYPNVTLLREPRRGANRARQTGFEASRGDLVAFIDADTKIPADWIDRVEQKFMSDPKLVCLSGPFIYYDLPKNVAVLVKIFYRIAYVIYLFNSFIIRKTSVVQGGTEMVRRTALEKIGGHNIDLTFYGDDTDLAMRLNKVGKVRFSFDFAVPSSGRRLAKEGAFTMGARYGINYFWIVLFNRPFTLTSKEIRPKEGELIYRPENKKREWLFAGIVIAIIIVIVSGIGYGAYQIAQSSVIATIDFVKIQSETKAEAQTLKDNIIELSHQTKNMLKESREQ